MYTFLFLALVVLVQPSLGAPVESPDGCSRLRVSSVGFNRYARSASLNARNGSTDSAGFSSSLVWLEPKDRCDPASLRKNPKICVNKIFSTLSSYMSEVDRISAFESCSQVTSLVRPAMKQLHSDMGTCVKYLGGKHEELHRKEVIRPTQPWKETYLCQYTLDRLFSFSILTARVFGSGDPAQHDEGSAQKCW